MAGNSKPIRMIIGAVIAAAVITGGLFLWINPGHLPIASNQPVNASMEFADSFLSNVERREAWYDHRAIAGWVAFCLGVHSAERLPEPIRASLDPPGRYFSRWEEEKPNGDITSQHRAVVGLSNVLFLERTDSVEKLASASQSLERFQVSIIIIGLLTTIFISLSSTDIIKDSTPALNATKVSVKIFAIILPVVGTAVAALNTFYDPKSDQIRHSRISEAASLLHREIALGVGDLACATPADKENWTKNAAQIATWINAHKTLISASSQKADTSRTAGAPNDQGTTGGSSERK